MARTTVDHPRISRRSIEVGMHIVITRQEIGRERTVDFTVARIREAADWTVVTSRGTSVMYSLTNNDVIRVIPAEGEVWA